MEITRISSAVNSTVKEAVKLERKRYRYQRRLFLTEGEDLLAAALNRGVAPRQVFLLAGKEAETLRRLERFAIAGAAGGSAATEIFVCSQPVMEKLCGLSGNTRVAVVFEMLHEPWPPAYTTAGPVLYLWHLSDPGNVGTLIRSAAALGAVAVMMGPGTADPYAAKSLRATMGSIFQIPFFLDVQTSEIISWSQRNNLRIFGAAVRAASEVWSAELSGGHVLILGSEREGIPESLLDATDQTIQIPQIGDTESMNAAMAGTAVLYEAMRQRSFGQNTA